MVIHRYMYQLISPPPSLRSCNRSSLSVGGGVFFTWPFVLSASVGDVGVGLLTSNTPVTMAWCC